MLKDEIMSYKVTVLGAGLAGCEAALWLAGKGVQVTLYEQKPTHFSPAHKSAGFAELICSNSLKAERLDSASGLLKEEMRRMGSQLLEAAEEARVAAGGALAVDRDAFSAAVTRRVEECPNITVVREQVEHIDESAPILVATGPLTDGALADEIGRLTGDERLHDQLHRVQYGDPALGGWEDSAESTVRTGAAYAQTTFVAIAPAFQQERAVAAYTARTGCGVIENTHYIVQTAQKGSI